MTEDFSSAPAYPDDIRKSDISLIKEALFDYFKLWSEHVGTILGGGEFTKLSSTPSKFIPVILPAFLQVVLLYKLLPGCNPVYCRQWREKKKKYTVTVMQQIQTQIHCVTNSWNTGLGKPPGWSVAS